MDIFIVIFSALWAGIGLIMKKYPESIAGYNTMSKEKRENVDIEAIGKLMYKGFLWIAAVMLVLYFTFRLFGMWEVAQIVWFVPIFIGLPVLLVMSQKYDKNPQSKFVKYLPAGIVALLFIAISIGGAAGLRPTKAIVEDGAVKFTGQYGVTVPLDEIAVCELWEDIPDITIKTNGIGLAGVCKGFFRLKGLGKCRLFIKSGNSPYLYIETKKGEKIIFNSPEAAITENLFEVLRSEQ